MQQLSAPELSAWINDASRKTPLLLDVREPWEYQTCHIDGVLAIPMKTIPGRLEELDADAEIVCICHHGGRSMQVANFLEQNGYAHVTNLTGGMHAWAQEVDTSMPTY
jgi:rhodanese-related sulfurtransferase